MTEAPADEETADRTMENYPLLGERSSSEIAVDGDVFRISNLQDRRARTIIALLCGSTIGTTAVGFFQLSGTRLVEAVLCREYYDEHRDQLSGGSIDERLCKVDSVQEQMAYIFGAYFAIRAIVCKSNDAFVTALHQGEI